MDELVTQDTPPAFIWSTFEDSVVTCENALRYATALKKANVRFALHVYPFGEHGLSTVDGVVYAEEKSPNVARAHKWVEDVKTWLKMIGV